MHYFESVAVLMAVACGIAQAYVEYNEITLDCVGKHRPLTQSFCGHHIEVDYYDTTRARAIQNNGFFGANCYSLGLYASRICCNPDKVPEGTTRIFKSSFTDGTCLLVEKNDT
ncbi:hypothetical protein MJO28_012141 [Puccinia striiformis f. sp. tritici]|uniref:Cyanovirin-N domain-containing protein n=4 Tax=Puccinia striiformis TaxID=27350 RepID=A0A0L0V9V5_9BASI|nr:hypothetical protein Pst134EB_023836 [Puccinia striiformis f. sp. tritici]KAI9611228.1 hypothetical protein KEM48_004611 [Puccinia striiformis f. sp. tritici PST-130]KNE95774.1 hypothetical protein PSTG_10836 [Puccinia striiformis f. sp. tritici PST-78]POW15206.1 hypothetical protein PSHT_07148 [Puccinia striiformis]KAI7942114.1 hypothetical protein MJO28_012141 [Puccinia striiformis f. sp. tritici]